MSSFLELVRAYKETRPTASIITHSDEVIEPSPAEVVATPSLEAKPLIEPSIEAVVSPPIEMGREPSPEPIPLSDEEIQKALLSLPPSVVDISKAPKYPALKKSLKAVNKLRAVNSRVLKINRELKKGRLSVSDAHLIYVMGVYGDSLEKKWVGYPYSMSVLEFVLPECFKSFTGRSHPIREINTDLVAPIDNEGCEGGGGSHNIHLEQVGGDADPLMRSEPSSIEYELSDFAHGYF